MLKLVEQKQYDEAQTADASLRIRLTLSVALAEAVADATANCPDADLMTAVNEATGAIEGMLTVLLKRAAGKQS